MPPDSSRIAFYRDDEIVVMNADGTDAATLEINRPANSPDWAPAGERIFYSGDHERGSENHTINADGTGHKRLTRRSGEDQSPSVSPSGRLVY